MFIQRRISFHLHLILLSSDILPSTWKNMWRKREKRSLNHGFYFLQSFTLLASPGVSQPTHSLTQPGEKFGGNTSHSLWHCAWRASCLNLKRHSLRWMLSLILNVFRVLAMWFSASFHDNLIINYSRKTRLHNKPGTRCCHLIFLNPYFFWLHNNPLIRYNVKYQCVNTKYSSFVLL